MWHVPDNAGNDVDKGHTFPNHREKLMLILAFTPGDDSLCLLDSLKICLGNCHHETRSILPRVYHHCNRQTSPEKLKSKTFQECIQAQASVKNSADNYKRRSF